MAGPTAGGFYALAWISTQLNVRTYYSYELDLPGLSPEDCLIAALLTACPESQTGDALGDALRRILGRGWSVHPGDDRDLILAQAVRQLFGQHEPGCGCPAWLSGGGCRGRLSREKRTDLVRSHEPMPEARDPTQDSDALGGGQEKHVLRRPRP